MQLQMYVLVIDLVNDEHIIIFNFREPLKCNYMLFGDFAYI